MQALIPNASCRLTDCRLVGLNTVKLGAEEATQVEILGDLSMEDFECNRNASIPAILSEGLTFLAGKGFEVRGQPLVQPGHGALLVERDNYWLELSALLLDQAPVVLVRSVRGDSKRNPPRSSSSQSALLKAVSRSPDENAQPKQPPAIPPVAAAVTPATSPELVRAATGKGPAAQFPEGWNALSGAAARVDLEVLIDERGSMVKIISAKGSPALLAPALKVLQSWTFQPAIQGGKAVSAVITVPIDFTKRT